MLGLYALALLCWQVANTSEAEGTGGGDGRWWGWLRRSRSRSTRTTSESCCWFRCARRREFAACSGGGRICRWWRRSTWGWQGSRRRWPFLKAAGEFRRNYYNAGSVGLHDITRAYRSIFVDYTRMSMRAQHLWMVVLVAFAAALVWGCTRQIFRREMRGRGPRIPAAEWVLMLVLAALPFCGYLLARFVTHSIEVRYVLGAVVAISAMVGCSDQPVAAARWRVCGGDDHAGRGDCWRGAARIHAEQKKSEARLASLVLPAEVKSALDRKSGWAAVCAGHGRVRGGPLLRAGRGCARAHDAGVLAGGGVALEPARHHGADGDAHRALHRAAGGARTRRCARSRGSICLCSITRDGTGQTRPLPRMARGCGRWAMRWRETWPRCDFARGRAFR